MHTMNRIAAAMSLTLAAIGASHAAPAVVKLETVTITGKHAARPQVVALAPVVVSGRRAANATVVATNGGRATSVLAVKQP